MPPMRVKTSPNDRAVIVVKNETKDRHSYEDIRGIGITLPPGGRFTSVVPLSVAHKMQQSSKLTVVRVTPL